MSGIVDFIKWPLSCKSGTLVIINYTINTIISWIFFPKPFSIFNNYLSDLGNYSWNPIGAYFYNFGCCILTSIALVPFYIGFKDWYPEGGKDKKLIVTVQFIGLSSAFSLAMIGIFSEDFRSAHILWSAIYFMLNLLLLLLGSLILYRYENPVIEVPFKRGGLIALVISIINMAFIGYYAILGRASLLEWITVFFSLGFVGLIVYFGRYVAEV